MIIYEPNIDKAYNYPLKNSQSLSQAEFFGEIPKLFANLFKKNKRIIIEKHDDTH